MRKGLMSQIMSVVVGVALVLAAAPPLAAAPDFSICDSLAGKAQGLCRAGVGMGCTENPPPENQACEVVEDLFEEETGTLPPWLYCPCFTPGQLRLALPPWDYCKNSDYYDYTEKGLGVFDTYEFMTGRSDSTYSGDYESYCLWSWQGQWVSMTISEGEEQACWSMIEAWVFENGYHFEGPSNDQWCFPD